MFTDETISRLRKLQTPFYFYDLDILNETCLKVKSLADKYGFKVHYAVKANANPRLLRIISSYGFGADCVSGNEISRSLSEGFRPDGIVFAGVGKNDLEIETALQNDIYCFNCESIPEIEVINNIAGKTGKRANIALRINPYIEAHTHKYITTGIEESKFGITVDDLDEVTEVVKRQKNLDLTGIHFHIGSQITRMNVFKSLCARINELQDWFADRNVRLKMINLGGGLGIDYENPEAMPFFDQYFDMINEMIELRPGQEIHIEPGRSIVGQCGSLISKVLYIKKSGNTTFSVIDAGMNDLIRPALYQARHKIENLTSAGDIKRYDVVGPLCESADVFGKYIELPETKRGDLIAVRSAGAYGEAMASTYNLRDLPRAVFSDEI